MRRITITVCALAFLMLPSIGSAQCFASADAFYTGTWQGTLTLDRQESSSCINPSQFDRDCPMIEFPEESSSLPIVVNLKFSKSTFDYSGSTTAYSPITRSSTTYTMDRTTNGNTVFGYRETLYPAGQPLPNCVNVAEYLRFDCVDSNAGITDFKLRVEGQQCGSPNVSFWQVEYAGRFTKSASASDTLTPDTVLSAPGSSPVVKPSPSPFRNSRKR